MIDLILTNFKLMLTNKTKLFSAVILPILLITVLGLSLNSLFETKPPQKVKIKIEYSTFESLQIIQGWSNSPDVAQNTEFVTDEAYDMKIFELNDKINVAYKSTDPLVQSIGNVYYKNLLTADYLYKTQGNFVYESGLNSAQTKSIGNYSSINSISFYSVTMLFLTIAYLMQNSGEFIYTNLKSQMGKRILLSGLKRYSIINAGIISTTLVGIVEIFGVILVLKTIFNDNVYDVSSMMYLILAIIFYNILGMNLALRNDSIKKFSVLVNILVPIIVMISGGYYKINFGLIKYISPNYWFTKMTFDNYLYQNSNVTLVLILILINILLYLNTIKLLKENNV